MSFFTKNEDLLPLELIAKQKVILIGAGSLGSHFAHAAACVGIGTEKLVPWHVFDDDKLAWKNANNQLYFREGMDEEEFKVHELERILQRKTGGLLHMVVNPCRVDAQYILSNKALFENAYIIVTIDSADGRKEIGRTLAQLDIDFTMINLAMPATINDTFFAGGVIHLVDQTTIVEWTDSYEPYSDAETAKRVEEQIKGCGTQAFAPLCMSIGSIAAALLVSLIRINNNEDVGVELFKSYVLSAAVPCITTYDYYV